jgi:hypothetical protein
VSQIGDATIRSEAVTFDAAVNAARQALSGRPDVLLVRGGYRFKRGWITDERVIVVEVRQKLAPGMLSELSIQPLPPQILGFGVDVRTAALVDQLESLGISWPVEEALPKAGQYREPPDLALVPVEEDMDAIFHISPDSGWPNLRDFIGRVKRSLTATMYEWNAPHVSDAIEAAIKPRNRKLKMVTQLRGTAEAVSDMESRLGSAKFEHAWASVGAGKLIPNAYHIKVASRDGEEFWLSSGNWKDSNQPNIDPAGEDSDLVSPLRKHNRDWHAVIANKKLATVFHKYIEWDFEEAERVPVDETVVGPLPELFVPVDAIREGAERRIPVQYLDPLVVKRKLYVHPFLTPDRDDRGRRVFIEAATKLVKRATRKLYVQNQSFNLLAENVDEFEQLLAAIAAKQEAGLDVRIIFRDSREFSAQNSEGLQRLLERLKDFGFDTDLIRVQKGCHTKAFIIDPPDGDARDSGEVLFGSHNLTNAGALYNRDASLLIKDAEVAAYFEKAFMFDWEVLATQDADELIGGVRLAGPHEETPPGFERVSLSELLGEA